MTRLDSNQSEFLFNLLSNFYGLIFPFNLRRNELIMLRRGGKVVEFMGMVKGGKSKQIRVLKEGSEDYPELKGLENYSEVTYSLGRPIDIAIFKPNSLIKVLYEKDENLRAVYNEAIIHLHGLLLNMLSLNEKRDLLRYLKENVGFDLKIREIDLAILDRGPNDDDVWTNTLYDYKTLISAEEREYHLLMARNLERHVDLAIGMNVLPEVAKEREGEREGNVMNIPFLRFLHAHYALIAEEAEEGEGQPVTIQTPYQNIDGDGDFLQNAMTIYKRVKGLYIPQKAEELNKGKNGLEDRINSE